MTAAAVVVASMAAAAQTAPESGIRLQPSTALAPPPHGEAGKALPIVLRAREVRGRPDLDTVAEGDAELRRGNTVVRAPQRPR